MSVGNFDFWRDEVNGSKDPLIFFFRTTTEIKEIRSNGLWF